MRLSSLLVTAVAASAIAIATAAVTTDIASARVPNAPPPQLMGNVSTTTAAEQAGQSRRLYLDLIAGMRRSGRVHAALAHLDAFDQQYPNSPDAAVLRGDCLVDLKDFAGARLVYGKLLKGREAAAAHAGLGRIDGLGGSWPAAGAEFARAVALAPTRPGYLSDYGFALLQSGDATAALFRIQQAAELAPADTHIRNNLIIALAATGRQADARSLLAAIPDPVERGEIDAAMTAQVAQTAAVASAGKPPSPP